MTTAPPRKPMTADELLKLPDDGNRYELVRGVLICMSPSSLRSSVVGSKIDARIRIFIDERRLGESGISEGGFKLSSDPDVVRVPDVWFVRAERVPAGGFPEGIWPGFPDLAVEILSPSDRPIALAERVQDYLSAGTRLVWAIDPEARAAAVFRPTGAPTFLTEDGTLAGEDVLPGFTLALRDVLPAPAGQ